MKKFLIYITITFFTSVLLYCQKQETQIKRNSAYIELGTASVLYSVNYERTFIVGKHDGLHSIRYGYHHSNNLWGNKLEIQSPILEYNYLHPLGEEQKQFLGFGISSSLLFIRYYNYDKTKYYHQVLPFMGLIYKRQLFKSRKAFIRTSQGIYIDYILSSPKKEEKGNYFTGLGIGIGMGYLF